jgi:hypothetical protein
MAAKVKPPLFKEIRCFGNRTKDAHSERLWSPQPVHRFLFKNAFIHVKNKKINPRAHAKTNAAVLPSQDASSLTLSEAVSASKMSSSWNMSLEAFPLAAMKSNTSGKRAWYSRSMSMQARE